MLTLQQHIAQRNCNICTDFVDPYFCTLIKGEDKCYDVFTKGECMSIKFGCNQLHPGPDFYKNYQYKIIEYYPKDFIFKANTINVNPQEIERKIKIYNIQKNEEQNIFLVWDKQYHIEINKIPDIIYKPIPIQECNLTPKQIKTQIDKLKLKKVSYFFENDVVHLLAPDYEFYKCLYKIIGTSRSQDSLKEYKAGTRKRDDIFLGNQRISLSEFEFAFLEEFHPNIRFSRHLYNRTNCELNVSDFPKKQIQEIVLILNELTCIKLPFKCSGVYTQICRKIVQKHSAKALVLPGCDCYDSLWIIGIHNDVCTSLKDINKLKLYQDNIINIRTFNDDFRSRPSENYGIIESDGKYIFYTYDKRVLDQYKPYLENQSEIGLENSNPEKTVSIYVGKNPSKWLQKFKKSFSSKIKHQDVTIQMNDDCTSISFSSTNYKSIDICKKNCCDILKLLTLCNNNITLIDDYSNDNDIPSGLEKLLRKYEFVIINGNELFGKFKNLASFFQDPNYLNY